MAEEIKTDKVPVKKTEPEKKAPVKKTAAKKTVAKKAVKKVAEAEDKEAEPIKKAEPKEAKAVKKTSEKKAKKTSEAVAPAKEATADKVAVKEEKKVELPAFKTRKATIRDYEIIKGPLVTEKTQILQTKFNTMVFKVAKDASASEIKTAVQAIFAVKVDKVNVLNVRAKDKKTTRYMGKVPSYKKAFVKINKEFDLGEIAKAAAADSEK
jgi:large subunit ribosomal protein L23